MKEKINSNYISNFRPVDFVPVPSTVPIRYWYQGFGAGAAQSRGIWLEPEPSLWPGSGSTLNICLIIHSNYMELDLI